LGHHEHQVVAHSQPPVALAINFITLCFLTMSEPTLPKSTHLIPDENSISEAKSLPVLSYDGKSTQFGELVAPKDGVITVIVIFSIITSVSLHISKG
jgi:hypothetical protein